MGVVHMVANKWSELVCVVLAFLPEVQVIVG